MKILISGATGFLGRSLTHRLLKLGHTITILTRSSEKAYTVFGNTDITLYTRDTIHADQLQGIQVVIHLAGASLLRFPRTTTYQKTIYNSRIQTTKQIVSLLPQSCHSFLCASAVGYYPSSLTTHYTSQYRNNAPDSFLEKLCVDREFQASQAKTNNRRVVCLRTGLVEGEQGFLPLMTLAIRWFVGAIPGSGKQGISTISKKQRVEKVLHTIHTPEISGPINMVTHSQSIENYMQYIARHHNRKLWCHIPTRLIKFVLGSFSSIVLGSQYIHIQKTTDT